MFSTIPIGRAVVHQFSYLGSVSKYPWKLMHMNKP